MKIIKVFITKTNATPDDDNVRINTLPNLFETADEIHISVTFTWDIPRAEYLYNQWRYIAPVKIGGPAVGSPGKEFIPGMYIKNGYTITSRGCNNKCWFCEVWKREGKIKEYPIKEGWNLLDDNILQCSGIHIDKVFKMLKQQNHEVRLTGGLEPKLITEDIVKKLLILKPKYIYCAYDTPDDLKHLQKAGRILKDYKLPKKMLNCYILIGYPGDNEKKAFKRIKETWNAGFFPSAMLYRNKKGIKPDGWQKFYRQWANKYITGYLTKYL